MDTIVVGKLNRNIYLFKGDDYWENISTGKIGRLKPEDAVKFVNIPLAVHDFAMKNPLFGELIKEGGFIFEGVSKTTDP